MSPARTIPRATYEKDDCMIVTANPITLMTKKTYHSMEEQGRGGSEFLDVNKGEHVNKVALPGFDVLGMFAIRW